MNEDLKWSKYDFTKTFDDNIVPGLNVLCFTPDLFTVSWLLGRFLVTTDVH